MRYFKYKNIKAIEKNALKVQYTEMTKAEKRTVNKETTLKFLGYIVLVIVSFTLVLGSNFLINRIPEPEHWLPAILTLLGILILKFVSFFISLLIGIFVSFPIFKKADETQRIVKQTALSRVCSHLRKYYGLCEPCLVTKCYDASDKKFKDHDVCMFIADGELHPLSKPKRKNLSHLAVLAAAEGAGTSFFEGDDKELCEFLREFEAGQNKK